MLDVLAFIATAFTLSFGGALVAVMLYLEFSEDRDDNEYLH